jgi:FlaA1/EpsC-like NDP-sugar epimerase
LVDNQAAVSESQFNVVWDAVGTVLDTSAGGTWNGFGIQFTGLRPGEKLFEELFHGREPPRPTGTPGLLMATPRTADPALVGRAIEEIASAARGGHTKLALSMLGRLVPEFDHNADGSARTSGVTT